MTKYEKWREESLIVAKFWHKSGIELSKSNKTLMIQNPRHIWAEKLAVWAELCLAEFNVPKCMRMGCVLISTLFAF